MASDPPPTPPPHQVIERSATHYINKSGGITEFRKDTSGEDEQKKLAALRDLVYQWPNIDAWPFKFGCAALGIAAAASSCYLNFTFRSALLLEHHLRVSSYLGMTAVSGFGTVAGHHLIVERQIFKNAPNQCPVCLQVRAGLLQLGVGLFYPLVLAPIASYSAASAFKDRYLPKLYKKPGDVLGFIQSVYKPIRGRVGLMSAGHLFLAMTVTYFQQECFYSTILPVVEGRETFVSPPTKIFPGLF